jgi:hypothetical protein
VGGFDRTATAEDQVTVPACPRRHLGRPGRGRLHLRLRRTRRIGDFTRWQEHDAYRKELERLLRDLKVGVSPAPAG